MKAVYNWRAIRSGKTITVQGVDLLGHALKITHVAEIQVGEPIVARQVDGTLWALQIRREGQA